MSHLLHKIQDKVHKHTGGGSRDGGNAPPFTHNSNTRKPVIPKPGQHPQGPGQMPPKVANTTYTTAHTFYHPSGKPHDTLRDLGFTGVLDNQLVWSWGDTLMGTEGKSSICAVDSTSIGSMESPMASMDTAVTNGGQVRNWIPLNADEEKNGGYGVFSFGGTNIVEVAPNKGLVYYLKMHRPGGKYTCLGPGVATCSMGKNGVPSAHRPHDTLWSPHEPSWGDVGVVLDADGRLYVFGHGSHDDDELKSRVYLARVHKDSALDLGAYEYYDRGADAWRRERPGNGDNGTVQCTKEMAVFDWHAVSQSVPFWSNHFNKWMLLHGTEWPETQVMCKTADRLEGPWHDHGEVAKTNPNGNESGFRYCVTAHPEFDDSGKKVLVTWTRNNVIYGVWIEWQ